MPTGESRKWMNSLGRIDRRGSKGESVVVESGETVEADSGGYDKKAGRGSGILLREDAKLLHPREEG